jgi:predicted transporter
MNAAERNLGTMLSHIFLRVLTIVTELNFLFFILEKHPAASAYGSTRHLVTVYWSLLSIVFLPSYLMLEWWCMRKLTAEGKPLLIDSGLVLSWVILLFALFVYGLSHHAIL